MKKKVLIIDDDPTMLLLLNHILNKKYEVIGLDDCRQAVIWLQDGNTPDLVICDIVMPGMTGVELLAHLKDSVHQSQVPFIMLSANKKSADRVNCIKLGADDYVVKPFNPEELEVRVDRLLN